MKYFIKIMQLLIMSSISMMSYAEKIYEKVNKQGEVEFSDQVSPEAQKVDVHPNVVRSVSPPIEGSTSSQSTFPQYNDNKSFSKDKSKGDEYKKSIREERKFKELLIEERSSERHEVQDATPRHEVQDTTPRHEVQDATSRREVQDATPRHEVQDATPRHEVE